MVQRRLMGPDVAGGTLVCLGECLGEEYGVIIAPGDKPPEIHAKRVPNNVVEVHG